MIPISIYDAEESGSRTSRETWDIRLGGADMLMPGASLLRANVFGVTRWRNVATMLLGVAAVSSCAAYGPVQHAACLSDANIMAQYRAVATEDKILAGGFSAARSQVFCFWGPGTYFNAEPMIRCSREVGGACTVLMRGSRVVFQDSQPLWDAATATVAIGATGFVGYQAGRTGTSYVPAPVYTAPPQSRVTDTIGAPLTQPVAPRNLTPSLCPDGSYVVGPCRIAPDGTYAGGVAPPQIAPNGKYVGENPRLAPDGSYVGGRGAITQCPDGSYVAGQCQLAPNGKYVGLP